MLKFVERLRLVIGRLGDDDDDDRGFGEAYKWTRLDRGFEEAKQTGKPIFLVIHRNTCPACRRLKDKFSKSIQLIDLSTRFVMINVEESGDESEMMLNEKFQPDGKYVPRILFYTSQGQLISEAYNGNSGDPKSRYFYTNPNDIVQVMRHVLSAKT